MGILRFWVCLIHFGRWGSFLLGGGAVFFLNCWLRSFCSPVTGCGVRLFALTPVFVTFVRFCLFCMFGFIYVCISDMILGGNKCGLSSVS